MKHSVKVLIIFIVLVIPLSINAKNKDFISVKTERKISLSELLRSSGYEIVDGKLALFLKEFMDLNEDIKSLSIIPEGKVIRLPAQYLKTKKKTGGRWIKKKSPPFSRKDNKEELNIIVNNIKKLFDRLGEVISLGPGKVIVFPVSEKASLSIDTDYFPMIELSGHRLILLDPEKRLPDDIKDVIEVYWPEYTVIGGKDIKGVLDNILDTIDYSCLDDGRVIIGDEMQVEIRPDCILTRKGRDIMESDMIILNITKKDEFAFPESLMNWAKDSGINIIDLYMKEPPMLLGKAELIDLPRQREELIAGLLNSLGYEIKRNVGLSLADKREYKLNIMADIAFKSGKGLRFIDLSGLPESIIHLLRRNGISITSIPTDNDSRKIIRDLLDFLSIPYETYPERISAMLTPKKVKYRIKAPGIMVKSSKGAFLLSDYHNSELLRSLIGNKISLIKFN